MFFFIPSFMTQTGHAEICILVRIYAGISAFFCLILSPSSPGVYSAEVCQAGLPGAGGLQQVQAGVDVDSNALHRHLGVLRGHRGQVERAARWVCLPGPVRTQREKEERSSGCDRKSRWTVYGNQIKYTHTSERLSFLLLWTVHRFLQLVPLFALFKDFFVQRENKEKKMTRNKDPEDKLNLGHCG